MHQKCQKNQPDICGFERFQCPHIKGEQQEEKKNGKTDSKRYQQKTFLYFIHTASTNYLGLNDICVIVGKQIVEYL